MVPKLQKGRCSNEVEENYTEEIRIDRSTEKALQKILSNNKITFQSIMESLLREYIYKNIEAVINHDK